MSWAAGVLWAAERMKGVEKWVEEVEEWMEEVEERRRGGGMDKMSSVRLYMEGKGRENE